MKVTCTTPSGDHTLYLSHSPILNTSTFPPNRRTVPGPGFYFLNMGACWKDSGEECDFDITTDVTRYILFQLPDSSKGNNPTDDPSRCGPRSHQLAFCPLSHTYRNGTAVLLGDPGFPYRAYHSVSPTLHRKDATTIALGVTPPPPPFRCKHDCWSNPQEQDWVRAEPSPEWAEYEGPPLFVNSDVPEIHCHARVDTSE
jgi:hypothetical protein